MPSDDPRLDRDISINVGGTYHHHVEFRDEDGVTPFDVSGWTFTSNVRELLPPKLDVIRIAINADSASSGRILLSISSASTSVLHAGRAYGWDIRYVVGGEVGYLWPDSRAIAKRVHTDD